MNASYKVVYRTYLVAFCFFPALSIYFAMQLLLRSENFPLESESQRSWFVIVWLIIAVYYTCHWGFKVRGVWRNHQRTKQIQRPTNEYLVLNLTKKLDFSTEELELNRNGYISDKQQANIEKQQLIRIDGLYPTLLVVIFFIVLTGLLRLSYINPNVIDYTSKLSQIIFVHTALLIPTSILCFYSFHRARNPRSLSVSSLEGQVYVYWLNGGRFGDMIVGGRLKVANKSYRLSFDQTSAFWSGAHYRIYTAGGRILSAELVG
jgi:hypothetical protein